MYQRRRVHMVHEKWSQRTNISLITQQWTGFIPQWNQVTGITQSTAKLAVPYQWCVLLSMGDGGNLLYRNASPCVPGDAYPVIFSLTVRWNDGQNPHSKSILEIRKDLHRRPHPFYPLMIYQIVKRYHRNVAVSTLSAENPRNNKMGRVLLWTGLHRGNFERESSKSKSSFSGDGSSPN